MEIKEITHPVMRAQKKRLDGLEQIITNNLEYLVQFRKFFSETANNHRHIFNPSVIPSVICK